MEETAITPAGNRPARRPTRAARVAGVCVLLVVAVPAFAVGVYAVAARERPADLPEWLGGAGGRGAAAAPGIGFTALGIASCLLGAAALALALALIVWPEKALAPSAPLGRAIARLTRSRARRPSA